MTLPRSLLIFSVRGGRTGIQPSAAPSIIGLGAAGGDAGPERMASPRAYERIAWEDRFNRPTAVKLRAALPAKSAALFEHMRRRLKALDGVNEDFAWHGACWRWTIEYRTKRAEEPLAVVVPSPSDLQLAVPLERDFVRVLEGRRLKRSIRDGLGLAREPFDTRWGVWSIGSEGLLDDLVDLIELKLSHLGRRAG